MVAAADIALLAGIYNVYFDEDVTPANVIEMLKDAGLLIAVGGGVVYGGVKLTEAGLAEVLNFVPGLRLAGVRHDHGLGHGDGRGPVVVVLRPAGPHRHDPLP